MQKILNILLILFLISIPFEANAISPGGIIKVFKGMGKVFKKGADELPDIGKKIEDLKDSNLKSSSKIDEAVNTSSKIDNTSSIKFDETGLLEIENLSKEELLELHNVKKIKQKQRSADEILDLVQDGIDPAEIILESMAIWPFVENSWHGKVFKSSNFFNNPEIEEKILILCNTNLEDFYFTALWIESKRNWFLLTGNFTNKNTGLFIPPMNRQELLVLEDIDEYIFFSNKPKAIKKYPSRYFAISSNGKFIYEKNVYEINSPDYFTNNIRDKIAKSSFNCKRAL